MGMILALFVLFQLKHWLCDYLLQNQWMLGKFSSRRRVWVPALAAHAAVHAAATFTISSGFLWYVMDIVVRAVVGDAPGQTWSAFRNAGCLWIALSLAAIDFSVHFLMDRVKASPRLMGRWKALSRSEYLEVQETLDRADTSFEVAADMERYQRGNKFFWWALGFDQMVHHLTHYYVIAVLLTWFTNLIRSIGG